MGIDDVAVGLLDRLLDDAPWARARLRPFAGRRAGIHLPPLGLALEITAEGRLEGAADADPDCEIWLTPATARRALEGDEAWMRDVRVSGSADLANALGFVLGHLRVDFEELLARRIGDIPARRLGLAGRRLLAWQRTAATNAAGNVVEFLREETGVLAGRTDVGAYVAEVECLRDDLARLERRVAALEAGKIAPG